MDACILTRSRDGLITKRYGRGCTPRSDRLQTPLVSMIWMVSTPNFFRSPHCANLDENWVDWLITTMVATDYR
jgi:hypothetical protein